MDDAPTQSGAGTAAPAPRTGLGRRAILGLLVPAIAVIALVVAQQMGFLSGGVRGSLGGGVSTDQVHRDFLADQDAEAQALAAGDAAKATGYITGNALQDLGDRISSNGVTGVRQQTTFLQTSLEFLREADPHDPETTIEVHETGYATVTMTSASGDTAGQPQSVRFDSRFWLRPVDGRYAITDETLSEAPGSPPPYPLYGGVVVLLLAAVGGVVVLRRRRSEPVPVAVGARVAATPPSTSVEPAAPPPFSAPWTGTTEEGGPLGIHTIGGLQVWADGADLAAVILDSPVGGFIWLRLLVQAIQDPARRVSRDELADEVFPGLDRATQLSRLRQRLHALRQFPAAVAERVRSEGSLLSFDLAGCSVDAVDVLTLATAAASGPFSPPQVTRAESLLAATAGDLLPLWESLDHKVTAGRGGSRGAVETLRDQLAVARVDLLSAVGDAHIAAGQLDRAIDALEEGLRLRPDREDMAQRLAVAYRAAGRTAAAARMADEYGVP